MSDNKSSLIVPIAVVICLLLIAGAVYFKDKVPAVETPVDGVDLSALLPIDDGANLKAFRPVDATDKLFGQADAPIKVVVYTDLECPACKLFHEQIKLLEEQYLASGQVALVYRDFPLDSLHSRVRNEFLAAECVREIGGIDKYWQFIDRIFEITPSNNLLDPAKLGETAKELKIDLKRYDACVDDKKYAGNIQKTLNEAMALNAKGTPFWLVVTEKQIVPVRAAVDASRIAAAFDLLLADLAITLNTEELIATSTPESSENE